MTETNYFALDIAMRNKGFKYRLNASFECLDFTIDGQEIGELTPEYYKCIDDCYTSVESFNVDGNSYVEDQLYTMRERGLLELEIKGVVINITEL